MIAGEVSSSAPESQLILFLLLIKAKIENPLIDLADNATQCQAATLKGTQCRRKTNLEAIEKTVNKQKYKFSVCSQHNNNDFMPFSEFLQNT